MWIDYGMHIETSKYQTKEDTRLCFTGSHSFFLSGLSFLAHLSSVQYCLLCKASGYAHIELTTGKRKNKKKGWGKGGMVISIALTLFLVLALAVTYGILRAGRVGAGRVGAGRRCVLSLLFDFILSFWIWMGRKEWFATGEKLKLHKNENGIKEVSLSPSLTHSYTHTHTIYIYIGILTFTDKLAAANNAHLTREKKRKKERATNVSKKKRTGEEGALRRQKKTQNRYSGEITENWVKMILH